MTTPEGAPTRKAIATVLPPPSRSPFPARYTAIVPKQYRTGFGMRVVNVVFRRLALSGMGLDYLHVLTVTGRTSGRERSVPIDVMDVDGKRYLVAPYGEVNWVRNLRASKIATLSRGSVVNSYDAVELEPEQSVAVIREYVRTVPITKAYWNVNENSTDAEVVADARSHPVFALSPRHAQAAQ